MRSCERRLGGGLVTAISTRTLPPKMRPDAIFRYLHTHKPNESLPRPFGDAVRRLFPIGLVSRTNRAVVAPGKGGFASLRPQWLSHQGD